MKRFIAILSLLLSLFFVLHAQKVNVTKRPIQYERSRDYDAKHYRIVLTFDLDKKYFEGENQITLTPLRDDFKECQLDAEELVVAAVTNSENMPLKFTQTDKHITVHLSKAYEYGETVRFTVKYHATNPKVGLFFDEESPDHPKMVSTVSWPDRAHHSPTVNWSVLKRIKRTARKPITGHRSFLILHISSCWLSVRLLS